MIKYKKYFIFIFLLALLSGGFCFAQIHLEIDYPDIGVTGVITPVYTQTLLTDYIKYIFNFSLLIAGLVAFVAFILGGYKHLTSAGNPAKISDARDQITSAVIGLVILLSSFLILDTLNPQLTTLKLDEITVADKIIELYPNINQGGKPRIYGYDHSLHDLSTIPDIKSIKIADAVSMGNVEIYIYEKANYEGLTHKLIKRETDDVAFDTGGWLPLSIKLVELKPGVYLCTKPFYKGECKLAKSSIVTLSSEGLEDKVQSIKFRDDGNTLIRAAIHEHTDYEGLCDILFDQEIPDLSIYAVGYGASSLTVLRINTEPYNDGYIQLCRNHACAPEEFCDDIPWPLPGSWCLLGGGTRALKSATYTYKFSDFGTTVSLPTGEIIMAGDSDLHAPPHLWYDPAIPPLRPIEDNDPDGISAVWVDGNYIAFLYEDAGFSGTCWVTQVNKLRNIAWGSENKGSSLQVIKVKVGE